MGKKTLFNILTDTMNESNLIAGTAYHDHRGCLIGYNDFKLDLVKRIYIIENLDTTILRAWQAHKTEQKWFYVCSGSFKFVTVKIDDFAVPSKELPYEEYIIGESKNLILHVPGGFANGFKSISIGSRLLVFSSHTLEESKADDYRFDPGLWYDWNESAPLQLIN